MIDKEFEDLYKLLLEDYNNDLYILKEIKLKEKKRNLLSFIIGLLIIVLVVIIIYFFGQKLSKEYEAFIAMCLCPVFSLPILFTVTITNHKESIRYRINIKKNIINNLLQHFQVGIEYLPEEGISTELYNNSEVEDYNIYHSKHLMNYNVYKENKVQIAETEVLKEYKDKQGETRVKKLYEGTFVAINISKKLKEKIFIKKDINDKLNINEIHDKYKEYSRVELDSAEFEKKFDVYTSDKIFAMQLLTADVMCILRDLYDKLQKKFEITIKDNHIYIRIYNETTFSNSLTKGSELDKELIEKDFKTLDFAIEVSKNLVKTIEESDFM